MTIEEPQILETKESQRDHIVEFFDELDSFSRDDKLIIILDKYDAFRRRSRMTHTQAIEAVRKKIKSNEQFADDPEFEELLNNFSQMILAKAQEEKNIENVLQ